MAKKYTINLQINVAQAERAAEQAVRGQQRVRAAAREAAQAIEQGTVDAAQAIAAAAEKSMVGLHKVQIQAIKDTDARVKRAERAAEQIQAINDRWNVREHDRMVKRAKENQLATDARIKEAEREAAGVQAVRDRWNVKEHDRQVRDAKAAQKAVESKMVPLTSLQASGFKVKDQLAADQQKAADFGKKIQDKAFMDEYNAKVKKAQSDAAQAKKSAAELQRIQDQATMDDYKAKGKKHKQEAADAKKAADKLVADAKKAADEQQKIQDKAFMDEYKARGKKYRDEADQQKRAAKERQKIEDDAFMEEYRARGEREKKFQAARAEEDKALNTGVLNAMAAAAAVVVAEWQGIREEAIDAQKAVKEYKESLKELAALKGQAGQLGKTLGEDLEFRKATLQTREEAGTFQKALIGAGESQIISDKDAAAGKHGISKTEAAEFAKMAGRFQASRGESAEVHGKLAGLIPMMLGGKVTADQAFAEEMRLYETFKPGNATFGQMAAQYTGLAGHIGTGLYNKEDASALLGAYSLVKPGEAGKGVEHLARATVGGLGRMKGAGVEGGERQGQYLTGLGVTNQMSPIEIAQKVTADFRREQAEQAKVGKTASMYDYLKHHGYGNEQDIQAMTQFARLEETGVLGKFRQISRTAPNVEAEKQNIEATFATEGAFGQRKADLGEEMVATAKGAGANEHYQNLKKLAYLSLQNKPKGDRPYGVTGKYEDWEKAGWTSYLNPAAYSSQYAVQGEMQRLEDEERKKRGLGPMSWIKEGQTASDYVTLDRNATKPLTDQEAFFRSHQEVAAKAGDSLTGPLESLNVTTQSQLTVANQQLELFKNALAAKNPAVVPKGKAGP